MPNTQYTALIESGAVDERDIDYLEHLDVPAIDDVALEGIIRAAGHDSMSTLSDGYREMKGWLLGVNSKRRYIIEICRDIVDWLDEKEDDYPKLDLDMGSFKTWMKTSESFLTYNLKKLIGTLCHNDIFQQKKLLLVL